MVEAPGNFRIPHWKCAIVVPQSTPMNGEAFLDLFVKHVAHRFARMSRLNVSVFPFGLSATGEAPSNTPDPGHPLCIAHAGSPECAEEWEGYLSRLRRRPTVRSHVCPLGNRCAVVPAVWKGRCLAATKLVAPSQLGESKFDQQVEVLDLLTSNFIAAVSAWLEKWTMGPESLRVLRPVHTGESRKPRIGARSDLHVKRARSFIQKNFRSPRLSIETVGGAIDLNPDYLAQTFAQETGERMIEYITKLRLRFAESLLTTTCLPVKVVATRSGFATVAWFRHLFHARYGILPSAFQLREHSKSARLTPQ